jgi:hypothetical protein
MASIDPYRPPNPAKQHCNGCGEPHGGPRCARAERSTTPPRRAGGRR